MTFPLRKSGALRIILPTSFVLTLVVMCVVHLSTQWELPDTKFDKFVLEGRDYRHQDFESRVNVPVEKEQVPQVRGVSVPVEKEQVPQETRDVAVNKQQLQVNRVNVPVEETQVQQVKGDAAVNKQQLQVNRVNVPVEETQVQQVKGVVAANKQQFQVNRALSNDRNAINRQLQAERNQYMKLEEEFSKRKREYILNITKFKYLIHDSEEKLRLLNTSYQQLKTKYDNLVASSNLGEGKTNQNNDQTELQGEIGRLKNKVMSLEQRLWSSTEKLKLIKNQLNGDSQGDEDERKQLNAIPLGRYLQDEQFADTGEEVVDEEK